MIIGHATVLEVPEISRHHDPKVSLLAGKKVAILDEPNDRAKGFRWVANPESLHLKVRLRENFITGIELIKR